MSRKIVVALASGAMLVALLLFLYSKKEAPNIPANSKSGFQLDSLRLPEGSEVVEHTGKGSTIEMIVFASRMTLEDGLNKLEREVLSAGFAIDDRTPSGAIYAKDGRYELAIFEDLDKPSAFVLMLLHYTPDEFKQAELLRENAKDDQVRAALRSHMRKIAAAQIKYFSSVGSFGTLKQLCAYTSAEGELLPKEYESGTLPDGTVISLSLTDGTYTAKAIRDEFSYWIDHTGRMEESPRR